MHQHRTILLAEPDARLRGTWQAGLIGMGFHVRENGNGPAALRSALASEINLLVAELYLATGIEQCLVRAARREPGLRRMKILVISEHGTEADRAWALSAGADAYLVKPVRLGRMLQVAAQLATSRTRSRAEVRAAQYAPRPPKRAPGSSE